MVNEHHSTPSCSDVSLMMSAAILARVTGNEPVLDLSVAQARKQGVVDKLTKGVEGLLKARGVKTFSAWGTLLDGPNHVVRAGDTDVVGDAVILATGSVPRTIPGFEPDGTVVFTSDEFLDLRTLPATAAVIGGGAIGCEFASTLADLGSSVTILEALPKILPGHMMSDVVAILGSLDFVMGECDR